MIRYHPKLTIGLPVYNGENYLREAIECLLAQSFSDFEIVICDNASTDATSAICISYLRRDRRIKYHRSERNLGATANFRLAFQLAKAPLFKWTAHDDLYHLDYLATCVGILRHNPDVVLAHSATAFIDDAGTMFPCDRETGQFQNPITGERQTPDNPAIGNDGNPAYRFWQVLSRARWGSHIFGVIRRDALARTKVLANFASSDRATLAELALLGRFQAAPERLYFKRFHKNGSWALDQKELKSFLGDAENYSRRRRQLAGFFSAPLNKPISFPTKAACTLMVAVHSGKILADIARGKDARAAAQGRLWRRADNSISVKERVQ